MKNFILSALLVVVAGSPAMALSVCGFVQAETKSVACPEDGLCREVVGYNVHQKLGYILFKTIREERTAFVSIGDEANSSKLEVFAARGRQACVNYADDGSIESVTKE